MQCRQEQVSDEQCFFDTKHEKNFVCQKSVSKINAPLERRSCGCKWAQTRTEVWLCVEPFGPRGILPTGGLLRAADESKRFTVCGFCLILFSIERMN